MRRRVDPQGERPGGDVEDWAYTGGRPLGVVLSGDGGLAVADADKVSQLLCKTFPVANLGPTIFLVWCSRCVLIVSLTRKTNAMYI